MSLCGFEIDIHGEALVLHPERAVWWPRRGSLIVADTHFGKGGILRQHGLAVPAGTDAHDRERLVGLLQAADAQRLVVLGDFLHAPLAPDGEDARELEAWCRALRPIELHVVAGNHDRGAAARCLPAVTWHRAALIDAPFRFTHDAAGLEELPFTLSGHVHPVVRLGGARKPAPRVPVFWQRRGGLVLPSFGSFTGGFAITPVPGERVFAAGPERVVPF